MREVVKTRYQTLNEKQRCHCDLYEQGSHQIGEQLPT